MNAVIRMPEDAYQGVIYKCSVVVIKFEDYPVEVNDDPWLGYLDCLSRTGVGIKLV